MYSAIDKYSSSLQNVLEQVKDLCRAVCVSDKCKECHKHKRIIAAELQLILSALPNHDEQHSQSLFLQTVCVFIHFPFQI